MIVSTDLILGSFLIVCGLALSLLNLKRLLVNKCVEFSPIMLSENIILLCIGISFVSKSMYGLNPVNIEATQVEKSRFANMYERNFNCNFATILMTYGPMITSFVNSFVNLIIDNYVYYNVMLKNRAQAEDNVVQDISRSDNEGVIKKNNFFKEYLPYTAIISQWLTPIIFIFSLYTISIKEKILSTRNFDNMQPSCMTMLNMNNNSCTNINNYINYTELIIKDITSNYLDVIEQAEFNNDTNIQVNSVVDKVYKIISNLTTVNFNRNTVTDRKSKIIKDCMKICYLDTPWLIVYLFILNIVAYFIPITISVVILTKVHNMINVKKTNKTQITRDFLYNIVFWSPVMFDTILSLLFCSYSMSGMRTSFFTVLANIYQVMKSFINMKYLKVNNVSPV